MPRRSRGLAWILLLLGSPQGCYLHHTLDADDDAGETDDAALDAGHPDAGRDAALDAGRDAALDAGLPDAGACDAGPRTDAGTPELIVDMLFVVDSSRSMQEEQAALAVQFPAMVRMLATGDLDMDGRAEFTPVSDLHVGVVTTNVDVGPHAAGVGCGVTTQQGDDGVLRTTSRLGARDCERAYPAFLSFRPFSGDRPEPFVRDFACLSQVGTQGCGFEQPLEAALKALTPAGAPPGFVVGEGRADTDNAGFVRDGSILAVLLVTDEDDCSIADPELLDLDSPRYPVDETRTNLRCFSYPEALFPVERYVEGLRRVRASDPTSFVFAAIAGVPADLVADPETIDYDALLVDPRMQERIAARGDRLEPACDVPGTGFALPARRVVRVAAGLGEQSIVQSICDATFSRALTGVTSRLARVIRERGCP